MAEKLHQSFDSERVDENRESLRVMLDSRVIRVLREIEQPLHWREAHLRAETEDLGEINAETTQKSLVNMTNNGLVARVEPGVYSLPEFAAKEYEPPRVTVKKRVSAALRKAGRPLNREDIRLSLEADGCGSFTISNVSNSLSQMTNNGEIIRVESGVYSMPEFAAKEYESSKIALKDRIDAVLRQAERPLQVQEVRLRLTEDGGGELNLHNIHTTLHRMFRAGVIVKTSRGVYSMPEFADKIHEQPAITIKRRIAAVLWQVGRPLHRQEIHWRVEADGLGTINPSGVGSELSQMVYKNLAVRTDIGVYSLPEFSYASDRKSDSYATKAEITGKVVNILNEVGGSSSVRHIYFLLVIGNLKGLSLEQTSNLLNRMAQEQEDGTARKIVRTAEDIYCLAELADEEYKEPSLRIQDRLLVILRTASKPLHLYDIYRYLEKEEHGVINLSSIRSKLSDLFRQGVVTRAAPGIYSMPEFAGKYYELPRLTTELRIELSLLEAARPLPLTEICQLVNTDDQSEADLRSINSTIALMAQEKKVIRIARGVYTLPEFADQDYE